MQLLVFLHEDYRLRRLGISPKTISEYDRSIRHLQKSAGRELETTDLNDKLILRYLDQRLRQVSPQTVKRERADLLAVWRQAYRSGLCPNRPDDIPTIRVPRKLPVAFCPEEVARLLFEARRLRGVVRGTAIKRSQLYYSLILFCYDTGARIGAALAVLPTDLDIESRQVTLRSSEAKTRIEQRLTISTQTADAVALHYSRDQNLVWPFTCRKEEHWRCLGRLLEKAELPNDRYHKFQCLRRTNYTLITANGSRELAGRQLGHQTDLSRYYLDRTQLNEPDATDLLPRPVSVPLPLQLPLFQ